MGAGRRRAAGETTAVAPLASDALGLDRSGGWEWPDLGVF